MESLIVLTESERQLLQFCLPKINNNIDFLISRFYFYFLKTNAGILFKHTKMGQQEKMFASALNAILTNITNPGLLEDTLEEIIAKHRDYGVLQKHIEYFVDSFMKALKDIFNTENDQYILNLWYKIISNIMGYFKDQI